jgi:hypothetical protein
VETAFELDLLTPVKGKDERGRDFEMTAALAGRGRVVLLYDRDGIVYRNRRVNRDFKLASRVEFDTPAPGVLQNVHGLSARVLVFGWVGIRSVVKDGEKLEVQAGRFTSEFAGHRAYRTLAGRGTAAPCRRASRRVLAVDDLDDSCLAIAVPVLAS